MNYPSVNYPSAADLAGLIYRKQREGIKIDWRSLRLHDKKGGNASTNSLALRAALSATKAHEAQQGRKILDTNRHQNSPVSLHPVETLQTPSRKHNNGLYAPKGTYRSLCAI